MALRIGPFAIGDPIGRGGMGEIRAGTHVALGAPVAVKILTEADADADARAAFRSEVRAVAALRHPNIVQVLDYGELPPDAAAHGLRPGLPYLVMERADGTLLERGQARHWHAVKAVLRSLLDALAHAHARGVIHCDVKLSNVLLGGTRPGLKLSDFGIAMAFGDRLRAERLEVRSVGTPTYMAPEQFRGAVRDYGPWTDLYAVGALTWKLVTGRGPFAGRDWASLMHGHLHLEVPRLDAGDAFPSDLEAWLGWLLEKDPGRRCRRAADAARALRDLVEPTDPLPRAPRRSGPEQPTITLSFPVPPDPTPAAGGPARPVGWLRLPPTWRRGGEPPPLAGAGLGLFGLRATPMVDRTVERDMLWQELEAAGQGPRVVLIRGPSGVGKTRLAQWIGRRAHEVGAAVFLTATHGPTPTDGDGLAAMFQRDLRTLGLGWEALRTRVAARLGVEGLEADALAALVAPDVAPRPPGGAAERHALATRLLDHLAEHRRIVLVLDDLQWGDDAAGLVCHLVRSGASVPVVVVATVRTPANTPSVAAVASLPAVRTLDLDPLATADVEALLAGMLDLHPALVHETARRAARAPLFAVELVRDWVDRADLAPGPDGYHLVPEAQPPPADLVELWRRRIATVVPGTEGWRALEVAAVLGREVQGEEWAAACVAAGIGRAPDLTERLLHAGLALPGPGGWTFAHGMLHDCLTGGAEEEGRLPAPHAVGAGVVEDDERLGLHLLAAGRPRDAVPPLVDGAARRDLRGELHRSRWLLERAQLALDEADAPPADPLRGEIEMRLCKSVRYDGDLDTSQTRLEAAVALARTHGWPCLAPALVDLATILQHRGQLSEAAEVAERALDAAERDDLPTSVIDARLRAALIAGDRGADDEAGPAAEALLVEAEARGLHLVAGYACAILSGVAQRAGAADGGEAWCAQGLAHHRAAGDRLAVLDGLLFLGCARWYKRDVAAAERDFREGLAIAELLGVWNRALFEANVALVALTRGEVGAARERLERALDQVRGRVHLEAVVHAFLVPCAAGEADWGAFDHHLAQARALLARTAFVDPDVPRLLDEAATAADAADQSERAAAARALAVRERTQRGG